MVDAHVGGTLRLATSLDRLQTTSTGQVCGVLAAHDALETLDMAVRPGKRQHAHEAGALVDFAIQTKGSSLRQGLDSWYSKAEGKAAIDYGFHLIMTEANPQTLEEMAGCIREGVTSFKADMVLHDDRLLDVVPEPWWKVDDPARPGQNLMAASADDGLSWTTLSSDPFPRAAFRVQGTAVTPPGLSLIPEVAVIGSSFWQYGFEEKKTVASFIFSSLARSILFNTGIICKSCSKAK